MSIPENSICITNGATWEIVAKPIPTPTPWVWGQVVSGSATQNTASQNLTLDTWTKAIVPDVAHVLTQSASDFTSTTAGQITYTRTPDLPCTVTLLASIVSNASYVFSLAISKNGSLTPVPGSIGSEGTHLTDAIQISSIILDDVQTNDTYELLIRNETSDVQPCVINYFNFLVESLTGEH